MLGKVVEVVGGSVPGGDPQDEEQEGGVSLVAHPPHFAESKGHRGKCNVHTHVCQRLQTAQSSLNAALSHPECRASEIWNTPA